jgi:hypothetical protein
VQLSNLLHQGKTLADYVSETCLVTATAPCIGLLQPRAAIWVAATLMTLMLQVKCNAFCSMPVCLCQAAALGGTPETTPVSCRVLPASTVEQLEPFFDKQLKQVGATDSVQPTRLACCNAALPMA